MMVFLFGAGALAAYQVRTLERQLDSTTQSVEQIEGKVKWAQYEKAKFFALARDVAHLAPKNPNAERVVIEFKLRELQIAEPALMAMPNTKPTTNAAPLNSPAPAAR